MQHTGAFWFANGVARWKSCCKELIMFFQNEEKPNTLQHVPSKMRRMVSSGRSRDGSFNDWEVFHGSRVGHADIRELCRAPIMRKAQTKIVFLRPFFKHDRQNDIEWKELNSVIFVLYISLHNRQLFAMCTRGGPELNDIMILGLLFELRKEQASNETNSCD